MTITKTLAIVAGEKDPRVKLWIVPDWIEGIIPGTVSPLRIICLTGLPTCSPYVGQGYPEHDRVLTIPLGKDTLEGGTIQGIAVLEKPDMIRLLYSTVIPGPKH